MFVENANKLFFSLNWLLSRMTHLDPVCKRSNPKNEVQSMATVGVQEKRIAFPTWRGHSEPKDDVFSSVLSVVCIPQATFFNP